MSANEGGVLIDTSAWIEAFRGSNHQIKDLVDRLLAEDRAVLCGIVEMELFQGLKHTERKKILPLLKALHYVEVEREDWVSAGKEYAKLRSSGITVPSTDVLIAVICMRLRIALLSTNSHFDHFNIGGVTS